MRIRYLHSVDLVVDPWHASGREVLRIVGTNRIINVGALREDPEARVITDQPEAVCRILGVSFPDRQVIEEVR